MGIHTRKSPASRSALPLAVLKAIQRSVEIEFNRLSESPLYPKHQTSRSIAELFNLVNKHSLKSLKTKNQLLPILSNDQVIYFDPENKYLTYPEQLWLIEAVIGTQTYRKTLSTAKGKIINNQFIEALFARAPFAFYLSDDGAYLLSSDDELTQLDFGPLTKISALNALQRFGVVALERAKEKILVRL